jgi:hypothetical protein
VERWAEIKRLQRLRLTGSRAGRPPSVFRCRSSSARWHNCTRRPLDESTVSAFTMAARSTARPRTPASQSGARSAWRRRAVISVAVGQSSDRSDDASATLSGSRRLPSIDV